jgi:hypothetical protein
MDLNKNNNKSKKSAASIDSFLNPLSLSRLSDVNLDNNAIISPQLRKKMDEDIYLYPKSKKVPTL